MAAVIAVRLRDAARACMFEHGGRGFMRFYPEGDWLLVTDAYGRCESDAAKAALEEALHAQGFLTRAQGSLLLLAPTDALLEAACVSSGETQVNWDSPLHPAAALAARFKRAPLLPLTEAGRRLVIHALRMTWQGRETAMTGLESLRSQAAVMLRSGDRSGMRMTAAILEEICKEE